jgi:hypothetical protein
MGNNIRPIRPIEFKILDKMESHTLLNMAENIDGYTESCHFDRANSRSRDNMVYSPNAISLKDKNYIVSFLDGLQYSIPQRLRIDLDSVYIIQLMSSADGGMPHTRPYNIICFPDISGLFSIKTMIHELWHIHQRIYHASIWVHVFAKIRWTPWNGDLPDKLEDNRRYNPDTIDTPLWIYDNTWVPVPIFRDITNPSVNQVDIWFYNPKLAYHVRNIPYVLQAYHNIHIPSAYEHPREITAYMLSDHTRYTNSIAFKQLLDAIGHTAIQ